MDGAVCFAQGTQCTTPPCQFPPPEPNPVIPAGDDIILYIHGGPGSRLEEAGDLVNPLLAAGLSQGKKFTIVSFDQPSQGYSTMSLPAAIVPPHSQIGDYYPMVQAGDEFIAAFVKQLDQITGAASHNIYIVGGSTGGMLALRMAARANTPWLKNVVAWNPASVWTTYHNDVLKGVAVSTGFCYAGEGGPPVLCNSGNGELSDSRKSYFDGSFGPPLSILNVQPNPEEWYRGDRDKYPSNADTSQPFATEWPCKWDYIGQARLEQQEIYNLRSRLWHYRFGTEELLFSFFNTSWVGPARTAENPASANYMNITKPTLLMASDDDDWNEGYVSAGDVSGLGSVLGTLGVAGGGVLGEGLVGAVALAEAVLTTAIASGTAKGSPTGPAYFPWENRWTQTRKMAPMMVNTPGKALFLENTGHSIHNERPQFLANQIATFVSQPATSTIPSPTDILSVFPESSMPIEQVCQTQLSPTGTGAFPQPIAELLEDAQNSTGVWVSGSATHLMEPAIQGGNFSDGKSAGQYSLRLRPELRMDFRSLGDYGVYPLPNLFLASAAVAYYDGGPDQGAPCTTALSTGQPSPLGNPIPGGCIWGNAFADLAVTGRTNYATFRGSPPALDDILKIVKTPPQCGGPPPMPCLQTPTELDSTKIANAILAAITRAYQVAWALRNPNPQAAFRLRKTLGWIAVSGEDDPPARPVNVSNGLPIFGLPDGTTQLPPQVAFYPQYELSIAMCPNLTSVPYYPSQCPGNAGGVPFQIRYSVAGLPQISSISPPVMPVGSTTPVTITGAHLVGVETVSPQSFGFTMNSPTQITLNIPPGLAPGVYPIQLNTTVAGLSYSSPAVNLEVVPDITSISRWSGPVTGGTTVTVIGSGLTQDTQVFFGGVNGVKATSGCFSPTNSMCTVVSPPATQPGPVDIVAVTNGAASVTGAADVFRYTQYPELDQFILPGELDSWIAGGASPPLQGSLSLNGNAPSQTEHTGTGGPHFNLTEKSPDVKPVTLPLPGATVNLYSGDTSVITVPPTVTIPTGSIGPVSFSVNVVPSTVAHTTWIIAQYQDSQMAGFITVPPWPAITVGTDQSLISSGHSTTVTVTLNSLAPAPDGAKVSLSFTGNTTLLTVPIPASLLISPGQNSGSFTLTDAYSGPPVQVAITATYNGESSTPHSLLLGCQPPPCPGGHVQGCVCVKGILPPPTP